MNVTHEEAYRACLGVFDAKQGYHLRDSLPDVSANSSLSACANDMMVNSFY